MFITVISPGLLEYLRLALFFSLAPDDAAGIKAQQGLCPALNLLKRGESRTGISVIQNEALANPPGTPPPPETENDLMVNAWCQQRPLGSFSHYFRQGLSVLVDLAPGFAFDHNPN